MFPLQYNGLDSREKKSRRAPGESSSDKRIYPLNGLIEGEQSGFDKPLSNHSRQLPSISHHEKDQYNNTRSLLHKRSCLPSQTIKLLPSIPLPPYSGVILQYRYRTEQKIPEFRYRYACDTAKRVHIPIPKYRKYRNTVFILPLSEWPRTAYKNRPTT